EFARNLERALSGDVAPAAAFAATPQAVPAQALAPARDPWVKVAAVFSIVATIIGLIILIKGLV
ncbi:MAG: hypothetical protein CMM31_04320, partial [Rhodospirillaceae bacterium]|nr:hypothetical protein [Rhodospirillaceae bacterium]